MHQVANFKKLLVELIGMSRRDSYGGTDDLPVQVHRTGRSPNSIFRGADRDRTDDLFVANEALSQLSYSPL